MVLTKGQQEKIEKRLFFSNWFSSSNSSELTFEQIDMVYEEVLNAKNI